MSFFYDINSLGNRHIGNNVRIMVFNNNGGNSLLYKNGLPQNEMVSEYVGAKNHYSNGKPNFNGIKAFVEALGYKYMMASNEMEFKEHVKDFLEISNKPIVFEIRYPEENDFRAFEIMKNLKSHMKGNV